MEHRSRGTGEKPRKKMIQRNSNTEGARISRSFNRTPKEEREKLYETIDRIVEGIEKGEI